MGLLKTIASLFEDSYAGLDQRSRYQCANCGSRCEDPDVSCPECGGEVELDETPAIGEYYWGPM